MLTSSLSLSERPLSAGRTDATSIDHPPAVYTKLDIVSLLTTSYEHLRLSPDTDMEQFVRMTYDGMEEDLDTHIEKAAIVTAMCAGDSNGEGKKKDGKDGSGFKQALGRRSGTKMNQQGGDGDGKKGSVMDKATGILSMVFGLTSKPPNQPQSQSSLPSFQSQILSQIQQQKQQAQPPSNDSSALPAAAQSTALVQPLQFGLDEKFLLAFGRTQRNVGNHYNELLQQLED